MSFYFRKLTNWISNTYEDVLFYFSSMFQSSGSRLVFCGHPQLECMQRYNDDWDAFYDEDVDFVDENPF